MKNDNWIVYTIIAITSTTTVLTMMDGTLLGFVRGILFAAILDGAIIFWERRGESLNDNKQRTISNGMKWAGVGMLVAIAGAYVVTFFVPVDTRQQVDLFGIAFETSAREAIHWGVVGAISMWVVLTLGIVLYLREIDPERVAELERTKAREEAEKERREQENNAYKTAMQVVSATVGTEKALRAFRENLKQTGYYTEYEIDQMVEAARQKITVNKTGGYTVDAPANRYAATAPDVTGNFTNPANTKK